MSQSSYMDGIAITGYNIKTHGRPETIVIAMILYNSDFYKSTCHVLMYEIYVYVPNIIVSLH